MFKADDVARQLRRVPFQPLRIVTSSGEAFEVRHPELVIVTQRYLIVGQPIDAAGIADPDRITQVPLLHVTALQDLPVAAPDATPPQGDNGSDG